MGVKAFSIDFNDQRPLRDVIFDILRKAIIVGDLEPMERLMEIQLSQKMGVSRTPVREAIRKLELEGLVVTIPRKGVYVAELSVKDTMDVLEVRSSLDGLATSFAAQRITEEELRELESVHLQFVEYVKEGNLQGEISKDVEFHDIIYKASRNDKLIKIVNALGQQAQRFRIVYLKDYSSAEEIIGEHKNIYQALVDKNANLAREFAQTHVERQKDKIISAMKNIKNA